MGLLSGLKDLPGNAAGFFGGVGKLIGKGADLGTLGLLTHSKGAGTPGGASAVAGTGGLMSTALDLAIKDVTGGKAPEAPAEAAAAKKPGFFSRINSVDGETGMSTVDKFNRFGASLQDISDGGDRAKDVDALAAGRLGKAKQTALAAQIDQLFPGEENAQMRFLLKAQPEKAAGALADVWKSKNEAYTLSKGQQRGAGGQTIDEVADYGIDGGYSWERDGNGMRWGDQRGLTHAEAEAGRHNLEQEKLGYGNLGVARTNAGTSAGHLGIARDRLNFDRAGGVGGVNGGGGMSTMSTADLIAALRGGR